MEKRQRIARLSFPQPGGARRPHACACAANRIGSISVRSSPVAPSPSNRSRTLSGLQASCAMIWDRSMMRHAGSNLCRTLSVPKCYRRLWNERTVTHVARTDPFGNGAPDRIRTCDLWNRNPTLYPAELRVHPCRGRSPASTGSRFIPQLCRRFNGQAPEGAQEFSGRGDRMASWQRYGRRRMIGVPRQPRGPQRESGRCCQGGRECHGVDREGLCSAGCR